MNKKIEDIFGKLNGRQRFNLMQQILHGSGSDKVNEINEMISSFFESQPKFGEKETAKTVKHYKNLDGFFYEAAIAGMVDSYNLLFALFEVTFQNICLQLKLNKITREEAAQKSLDLILALRELEISRIMYLKDKKGLIIPPEIAEKMRQESILLQSIAGI